MKFYTYMRTILLSLLLIISIVSVTVLFFTFNQVTREQVRLQNDIQYRSTLLAESLRETVEPNFVSKSETYLQEVVERFADKERIAGLAIVDNKGKVIAASSTLPKELTEFQTTVAEVMDSDKANGAFVKLNESQMYVFAVPLHQEKSVVGALVTVQHAGYIQSRIFDIWRTNLIRVFVQVFLISFAILLILRWIIYQPIKNLVETIQSARMNPNPKSTKRIPNYPFFQPLVRELSNIQRSLTEARFTASEEARLRLEKLDTPWTAQRLKEFIKDILKGRALYVVSNREPYIHVKNGGHIKYFFPASGMATALEPIMIASGGTWIAHGSGDADRQVVDSDNKIKVPPDEPTYTLRRVWLKPEDEKGYYYGFSNEGLWPLCHIAHTRPMFRKEDWEKYEKVNGKFAQTILQEVKNQYRPIILIQDYHFALLPQMVKKSKPDAVIGLFWHIPWPNSESFSICPFRKDILKGMLGADLIGFHTQQHCNNFIDTISRELESLVDLERYAVIREGHSTYIKPFPISIALSNTQEPFNQEKTSESSQNILKNMSIRAKYIGLGVDRLDYTKGITERFKAIEVFFEKYPSYKEKFTFIQIAPPSRSLIKRYIEFEEEVTLEATRINEKYEKKHWKPIILLKKRYSHDELDGFYKLAHVCLVTSLHDGMNLVAKEFIAARNDERGSLVLSQFAGASRELKNALIVNPYNAEEVAEAMKKGLTMMQSEQIRRMRKMRETIKSNNVYRWSADLIKTLTDLE